MDKAKIIAYLNLHAVLPRLEELVKVDDEARRIAESMNLTLHFRVKDGPCLRLSIIHGKVSSTPTLSFPSDVGLYFTSCDVLNRMFRGDKKALPVPYWFNPLSLMGKMASLKSLLKLMDILPRYLKPSEEDLKSLDFRKKHAELVFMVALNATCTIADHDVKMKKVVGKLKDGTAAFNILPDGPFFHINVRGGHIEAVDGPVTNPTATVDIRDVDLAIDMMNDRVDTFAATGSGDLCASGALLLVDEYNALLDRAGYFLSKM